MVIHYSSKRENNTNNKKSADVIKLRLLDGSGIWNVIPNILTSKTGRQEGRANQESREHSDGIAGWHQEPTNVGSPQKLQKQVNAALYFSPVRPVLDLEGREEYSTSQYVCLAYGSL